MLNTNVAYPIALSSFAKNEFYAVIIPEEKNNRIFNAVWLFRKGCGTALFCSSSLQNINNPIITEDGIKALDVDGKYDEIKQMLIDIDK